MNPVVIAVSGRAAFLRAVAQTQTQTVTAPTPTVASSTQFTTYEIEAFVFGAGRARVEER